LGGTGFATAKALAGSGRNVMLNGLADAATIAAGVAELQALGARAAQWLRHEMQRDGSSHEEANFLAIRQPSRRFVQDANAGGLIAFLCSPHSGDINGAALPIDGSGLAGH
jgi:3-hydroxybutyrate dehydrogenase